MHRSCAVDRNSIKTTETHFKMSNSTLRYASMILSFLYFILCYYIRTHSYGVSETVSVEVFKRVSEEVFEGVSEGVSETLSGKFW